jgi:hypothetical protein
MGFPPNHRSFYDRCARRSGTVRASRRSGELSWTSTGLLALPWVKFPQQRKFPTAKRLMELPGTPHDYQINDGLQSAAACDQRDGHKLVKPQMFDDGRRFGLLSIFSFVPLLVISKIGGAIGRWPHRNPVSFAEL